jgi:hypothetical protein
VDPALTPRSPGPEGPDLDIWLDRAVVRVTHRRETGIEPDALWAAAKTIRLSDTRTLGRLVRLRIPGLAPDIAYDEMFRHPPFNVLHAGETTLVSGLVGRIWTLRRDYPALADPDAFRTWRARSTVRVLFAIWVEPLSSGGSALVSETRVAATDRPARVGVAMVRPLIVSSHHLVGSEGLEAAIARAGRAAS